MNLNYFLKSFNIEQELFCLKHNSDLNLNEIYFYSKNIFHQNNKKSFKDNNTINVTNDKGINISKLEKGCLILNNNEPNGYTMLNIDNQSQETEYWTNKFLNIKPLDNNSHKTKDY